MAAGQYSWFVNSEQNTFPSSQVKFKFKFVMKPTARLIFFSWRIASSFSFSIRFSSEMLAAKNRLVGLISIRAFPSSGQKLLN
jgi:hypothetical protein